MKLLNKIFAGIVCGAIVTTNALAGDDCANIAYKQSHPERCKYTATSTGNGTLWTIGGGVVLGAGVAALVGLSDGGGSSSSGGGVSYSARSTYYSNSIQSTDIRRNIVGGDVTVSELASAISTNEYTRNEDQYDAIQLAYSIARNYTGQGTTIAVFDTELGTRAKHAETVMAIANGPIAPRAVVELKSIAADTDTFKTYYDIGDDIASVTGANVYNNSWNKPISSSVPVIRNATDFYNNFSYDERAGAAHLVESVKYAAQNHDAIFVWAAGNDSYGEGIKHESGVLSAMPIVEPELQGHFINVVAWDTGTSALADYSNICGATKDFCITAPGSFKMNDTDRYAKEGTSFAAPVVSAAIAVIREAWNYLESEKITQILFDTAADLGESGVDEIYGHGMLDLEAATRPVGTPTITISDTVSQPLQVARVSAQIAHNIQSSNLTMAFFDRYGRDFQTNLSDNISAKNRGLGFERLRGDDARAKVNFGDMEFGVYRNDMLTGTGFMATDGETTTTYVATNKSYNLGNFEIFGRTQLGIARPHVSAESIISDFSNIYTASAYIGVRGDKWSLSVGMPDTIVNGNMQLHLATGRNNMGVVTYRDYNIDMTSTPAVEYTANYRFVTAGYIDNPYGMDEFYVFAKTKLAF